MIYVKIFKDSELALIHLEGKIGKNDVIMINSSLFSHPDFRPHFNCLVDARKVKLSVTSNHMPKIYHDVSKVSPITGSWAHLSDDPRYIALTMEYITLSKGRHPCRIVYSLKEAERFLGYDDLIPFLNLPPSEEEVYAQYEDDRAREQQQNPQPLRPIEAGGKNQG